MHHPNSRPHCGPIRSIGRRLILAGAFASALAMPARAEDRAVVQRFPPAYPELAKRMRITGVVKMSVTVNPAQYVTLSYGRLFEQWRAEHNAMAENLTFAECVKH